MKILFKQFFKSFKKNHFNIFSLSVLMTALGFVISSAANLSYSFITSINELNSEGTSTEVVSNVPSKFGKLDFSYSVNPVPQDVPVNIITSSLELNKDPSTGKYLRENNTLFPYSESDFIADGKKFKSASLITFGNGWTYNRSSHNDDDMFFLATQAPHPIYNMSAGEIRLSNIPGAPFNKQAFSVSFSDTDNKLLFVPNTMLFNKMGIPYSVFDKGNLTQNINLYYANIFYNADTFKKQPNWTDDNGVGVLQNVWERHGRDADTIDRWNYVQTLTPETFDYWPNTLNFAFYQLSKYIKVEENVPSYEFSIDLGPDSGTSQVIKTFIQSNPSFIKTIFNDVFYAKDFTRDDINYAAFTGGKQISDPISLIEKDGQYKIRLSIPDRLFVDLTSPEDPATQITENKESYLKNFANFLSEKFTNSIYEEYKRDLKSYLLKNDVIMNEEKEYFYHEPKQDVDELFVEKNVEPINEIVVSEGNNLSKEDVIQETKEMLNSKINSKPSRKAFYAMYKVINMIPQSNIDQLKSEDKAIPKLPSAPPYKPDPAFASSSYLRFKLFAHCIKQVCLMLSSEPTDVVPQRVINSPEMKTMILMMAQTFDKVFQFNTNGIQFNFNARDWIVPLTKPASIDWTINIFSTNMTVISQAYAVENDKKYLPVKMNKADEDLWKSKIKNINEDATITDKNQAFSDWIDTIKNTSTMALSPSMITELFSDNSSYFDIWKTKLPFNYKIKYQNLSFIIVGYGLSPDFAYPVISPTSPIPDPKNQLIAYLCKSAFEGLGANQSDIVSYYSYYSASKTPKEIVDLVKSYDANKYGQQIISVATTNAATFMQTIWLRSYFPQQVVVLIAVFAICSAVFLILLSLFTISFLMKSLIKNLLEPIAVCLANGTSFKKILWAILLNIGILTTITSMIGFTAAFLLQAPLLSLFSSIWFIPTQTVWYTPAIFLPLVFVSFGALASMLTISLKKQLKKPVPEILANKQTIKTNKLTNVMRSHKIKGKLLPKMSYGFSTINLGRLSLLAVLGALSVGTISSSIVIKSKFDESYSLTHQARNYDYEYQLQNINESTGLMKPQEFNRLGFTEPDVGITSLYSAGDLIYRDDQLVAKMIPYHGDKTQITTNTKNPGTLANLVLPSYKIYDELKNRRTTTLYNSVASLFLLKVRVDIGVTEINIWDFVSPYFPSWVVAQLEDQLDQFKDAIMNYYGEWYFDFIDFNPNKSGITIKTLQDNNDNNLDLNINNVTRDDAGYYFAETKSGLQTYRTKPFYVWPDSQEWYLSSDANIAQRFEVPSGSNITMNAKDLTFNLCNDNSSYDPTDLGKPLASVDPAAVQWKFVPAYNNKRELAGKRISKPAMTETHINDAFMDFITVVFSDTRLTCEDSKLTFGIIPYKPIDKTTHQGDEKVTKVLTKVYRHKKPTDPLEIYGIKPHSDAFPLLDAHGYDISSSLYTNQRSNEVNVIVNNGVALRYKLDVGDTLRVSVDNNSLQDSYNLMNKFIYSNNSPINNDYTLRVVGISSDSFGEKVYVDQKVANRMTGLDQMHYYDHVRPDKVDATNKSTITRVSPNIDDYDAISFPFNTIVSKSDEMLITKKNIPFYSYANAWGTDMDIFSIQEFPAANTLDSIVTFNQPILLQQANTIKRDFDPTFDATDDANLRDRVLHYYITNFSSNKIKQALELNSDDLLLKNAAYKILPTAVTEEVFNIISTLATTLIVASISLLIPLLLLVCISTSLSIITGLAKQINLLKVLGYSNRNVVIMFLISFVPVFLVSAILGLGIVFAINYGLQFMLFSLSSVFIYPYVYPLPYIVGIITLAAIFSIALISAWAKMNRSKLDTAIKF